MYFETAEMIFTLACVIINLTWTWTPKRCTRGNHSNSNMYKAWNKYLCIVKIIIIIMNMIITIIIISIIMIIIIILTILIIIIMSLHYTTEFQTLDSSSCAQRTCTCMYQWVHIFSWYDSLGLNGNMSSRTHTSYSTHASLNGSVNLFTSTLLPTFELPLENEDHIIFIPKRK